jgi:hypothetical protein
MLKYQPDDCSACERERGYSEKNPDGAATALVHANRAIALNLAPALSDGGMAPANGGRSVRPDRADRAVCDRRRRRLHVWAAATPASCATVMAASAEVAEEPYA